ncbi:hypothetical protein DKX38_007966 [Salix brachista]|uniref:Uncharacterized protein n=1 Tax=Salix brachista TaxID=2182728 RepID=A0A5N5MPW3_9ROSI|nr:hypothetical protein DKX38_007966 [Salix brachista]
MSWSTDCQYFVLLSNFVLAVINILKGWEVVMVCQAASQTNFRALKHENGIAGCATIIVKVIACFQPLQDCQVSQVNFIVGTFLFPGGIRCYIYAEYFRHLLKPVT